MLANLPFPEKRLPVVVVGAGGHAKVVLDALRVSGHTVRGLCDAAPEVARNRLPDETILGDDEAALALERGENAIAIGVGATRADDKRRKLFRRYHDAGFEIVPVIHPSAIVAADVSVGSGVQIMAGAVIQTGTTIGANAVINTRASIDHDCRIGDHTFVAPGVTLCGGVIVGEGAHVGAGATVLEGRTIGVDVTIGGGALVNRDIGDGVTVIGVPAINSQERGTR